MSFPFFLDTEDNKNWIVLEQTNYLKYKLRPLLI